MITNVQNQVTIGDKKMDVTINPQTGVINASIRINNEPVAPETEPQQANLTVNHSQDGKLRYMFDGNIEPSESIALFKSMKTWIAESGLILIDTLKSL